MIGVYLSTSNMTSAMHAEVRRQLEAAGVDESAIKSHAVMGDEGELMVFDIWESREAWDSFEVKLGPILQGIGIELNRPPDVMAIVALPPSSLTPTGADYKGWSMWSISGVDNSSATNSSSMTFNLSKWKMRLKTSSLRTQKIAKHTRFVNATSAVSVK